MRIAVAFALVLGGMHAAAADPLPAHGVFDRIGGMDRLNAIANDFVARAAADPRVAPRVTGIDSTHLARRAAQLACVALEGPCEYTGQDLILAHANLELVSAEVDAFTQDLTAALEHAGVADADRKELLSALAPLRAMVLVSADHLQPLDDADLARASDFVNRVADRDAHALLSMALVAGRRGQRAYAERLFTRAERTLGSALVAPIAPVFRHPVIASPRTRPATHSSLRGRVRVGGSPPGAPTVIELVPCDKHAARTMPPFAAEHFAIAQRDKRFRPAVLTVPLGSTVSFPNEDAIFHGLFSVSHTQPFDFGVYEPGDTRSVTFERAGIVRLGCTLHANASAYVVVVDSPLYNLATTNGVYSFANLAPGKYTLKTYSGPTDTPTVREITLKRGENVADLEL